MTFLFNYVAAHILAECFGHGNRAVGILEVFKDSGNGTAYCHAGAVKGVNVLRLVLGGALKADTATAGLIILKVRAGGNLNVSAVGGHPNLDVVGLGGREAKVARAEADNSIGKS